jgi:hypothetical protein
VGPDFDHRTLAKICAAMARRGWVLPSWFGQQHLSRLARMVKPIDWDRYFLRLYERRGGDNRDRLFRSLHLHAERTKWRTLIADAECGVQHNLFSLLVPATLAAIEGISRSFSRTSSARFHITGTLAGVKARQRSGKVLHIVAESLEQAVAVLFSASSFSNARPSVLNRHWVLHGVDPSACTRANAWRALQALDHLLILRQYAGAA